MSLARRTKPGRGGARGRKPSRRGRRQYKPSRRKQKSGTEEADEVEKFTYQKTFTQNEDDD